MNKSNKFRYMLFILFSIVVSMTSRGQAQDEVYAFRIETSRPEVRDMMWSADSTRFVYLEQDLDIGLSEADVTRGVFLSQAFWKSFDVETGLLSSSMTWPLYPHLTEEQSHLFHPRGFIYPDSQGLNILYVDEMSQNTSVPSPLTVANLSESHFFQSSINIGTSTYPESITVLWSDAGNSVIVRYIEDYVYSAEAKIVFLAIHDNNSELVPFDIRVNGQHYISYDTFTDKLYDIDSDGEAILLVGRVFEEGQSLDASIPHPIIWYPHSPENSLVLNELDGHEISAMSFLPNNQNQILLINRDGLVLYDLETGQREILFSEFVNDFDYLQAKFSPNGEWLMLQFLYELRFLHITSILSE